MDNKFLTEEDFKDFSSYRPAIIAIATMALTISLIEITHTRFLAAFVILTAWLAGRVALFYDFKKWRKKMVSTGHITYAQFDDLSEKYNVMARHWFSKKDRVPFFIMATTLIFISSYFFYQDLQLKMYGKETIGTVYEINTVFVNSAALIEFNVDGNKYTTSTKLQIGDNFSVNDPIYRSKEHVKAQIGQTFRILYSSKDPTINRLIDDLPIAY